MVIKCYEFKMRCKKTKEALILYNRIITQDIVRDLDDKTMKNQNTTQVELDEKETIDFTDFNDSSNDPELTGDCDKPERINVIKIELFDQMSENTDKDKLPVLTCGHCLETFSKRSDLNKHLKLTHKDKTLVCDVCNQSFTQIQTLKRHSKIHQSDQKNKLCAFCGKCFVRTDDLRRHLRIHTNER